MIEKQFLIKCHAPNLRCPVRWRNPYSRNTFKLSLAISEAYTEAVDRASSEVEEGRYEPHELAKLVNRQEICDSYGALRYRAMILISTNLEI